MPKKPKDEKPDLYSLKRKLNKQKREIRNKILGTDTVDGSSMQRFYSEATKTRRALKIEYFGSKSKASNYGDDTSIEKFIYDLLNEWNIEYKPQKAIRYINVDAMLPAYNTVLQINGDYWHCHPKLYPEPKNNIQRKNIEKDKVALDIIKKAGHHLIEIWEDDIKKRPELVSEKLFNLLAQIKNGEIQCILSASSIDW
jgi:G:T-mismatch repair DNA endonuclease (very short patch repair protein)